MATIDGRGSRTSALSRVVSAALFGVAVAVSACGGGGGAPKQAEGPKPDLDAPPKGSAAEKPVAPAIVEAQAALESKNYPTARAKAQSVLDKDATDADAHFVLGVCDDEDGKKESAIAHYQAALQTDPKMFSAAINLASLLADAKRFDEAAEVARGAISRGGKGLAELHTVLAIALKGQGKHDLAARSYANAIALKPDDAELYLWQGEAFLDAGDKDGALRAYRGAAAHAKDDAQVLGLAAIGLAKAGDATGCVSALDRAIAKKATSELLTERAICKHVVKDLAGARVDLDAAIAKAPTFRAHVAAGTYAGEAGDKKACRAHFLEAAKIAAGKPGEKEAKERAEKCAR